MPGMTEDKIGPELKSEVPESFQRGSEPEASSEKAVIDQLFPTRPQLQLRLGVLAGIGADQRNAMLQTRRIGHCGRHAEKRM